MKFTVEAGKFGSALKFVQGRAKGVAAVIPILKSVLVTAGHAEVSVMGNGLDSSSLASLEAEVATPGSWAIPADPLARIVGGMLRSSLVTVEYDAKSNQVTVKSGRSRYTIPVMQAADFPDALSAQDGVSFKVAAQDLEQLFGRPAGVVDLTRVPLSGVYVHDESGVLASCATDGHSLRRFSSDVDAKAFAGAIVPNSALAEIIKTGPGTLSFTGRTVEIVSGTRSYCSKLVDAKFPDYRRVVPEPHSNCATVDRQAMIESLSRLNSIEGFSECSTIDVTFGSDEINITITGNANGSEVIECETAGTEGFFCLQTRNLLDACKAFKGDKLGISARDELSAIRIVDPSEPSAIGVEMPCRSKNQRAQAAA
ncbi:MAG: polymerase subunit beta [Rhizobium sp.]|nr:polymerase subunit beta [Rhizobium sp.]